MDNLSNVKLLEFKEYGDEKNNLFVIEVENDILFEIKRVFGIYDHDKGIVKGKHAN